MVTVCTECHLQPLIFHLCVPLDLKWVSCRYFIIRYCFFFFTQSANQCLLIGKCNSFTFKVITTGEEPTVVILLLVLSMSCSFFSLLSSFTAFLCVSLTFYSDMLWFLSHLFLYRFYGYFLCGDHWNSIKIFKFSHSILNWQHLSINCVLLSHSRNNVPHFWQWKVVSFLQDCWKT